MLNAVSKFHVENLLRSINAICMACSLIHSSSFVTGASLLAIVAYNCRAIRTSLGLGHCPVRYTVHDILRMRGINHWDNTESIVGQQSL